MKASAMPEVSFKRRPALSDAEKIVNLQRECQRLTDEADRLREFLDEQRNAPTLATITEAKRVGAAEALAELRRTLQERIELYGSREMRDINFDYTAGFNSGLILAARLLDELAPTVTCDNPPWAGVIGASMQVEIDYCVDTLLVLGPSDLCNFTQQLQQDDPAQAERLRKALSD